MLTSTTLDGSFINDDTVSVVDLEWYSSAATVSVPFTNNGTVTDLVFQPVDPLNDPALAISLGDNSTITDGEFGNVAFNVDADAQQPATLNNAILAATQSGATTTITGGALELTGSTNDYVPNLLLDGANVTANGTVSMAYGCGRWRWTRAPS